MALQTNQVTLPADVSLAIVAKAQNTSTIAKLSPADQLSGWFDAKYNVFQRSARAEVVAEGAKKTGYNQTITPVEGKRFTVQTTTRVSKQLQWADESDQLRILDAIQQDQTNALGEALDYVVYHAVSPLSGAALEGFTALSGTAAQVTAGDDALANLDALSDALLSYNISGVALSRKWANELRKLRVAASGARLFDIPLGLDATASLDGIPAAVSTSVSGDLATDATNVLAFMGDFTSIRWRIAQPIAAEIIPYGDPDGNGDLAASNQIAYRTEAVFSYAVLDPKAIAVLKAPAAPAPGTRTAKAAK